jgi:hypothetical protein
VVAAEAGLPILLGFAMHTLDELPLVDALAGEPLAPTARPSERFAVDDPRAYEHLAEHGYVVIREVADREQTARIVHLFWDHLEGLGTGIKRDAPATWDDERWIGDPTTGILPDYGVPQSAMLWACRGLPRVEEAFARIWDTRDLLVSFDGGGAFRPVSFKGRWKTRTSWYHVDQNGVHERGFQCVQGLVNLIDAGPERGGLVVVPGSHRRHAAFFEARRQEFAVVRGFVRISPEWLARLSDQPPLKVCCEAGDLVLWDSRTVHCNTRALAKAAPLKKGEVPGLERLVAYVCMTPRYRAYHLAQLVRERHTAFMHGAGTNHVPHEFVVKPSPPGREGVPVLWKHVPAELGERQRQLAGFDLLDG